MSFNIAFSGGVSNASLHALDSISLDPAAANAAASTSIASIDDVPPCGTPTPGHPPVPHGLASLLDRVALNPQPLPPKEGIGAMSAGGRITALADGDWCGTVPHKLPHFPPPPPGPWADLVNAATGMAR